MRLRGPHDEQRLKVGINSGERHPPSDAARLHEAPALQFRTSLRDDIAARPGSGPYRASESVTHPGPPQSVANLYIIRSMALAKVLIQVICPQCSVALVVLADTRPAEYDCPSCSGPLFNVDITANPFTHAWIIGNVPLVSPTRFINLEKTSTTTPTTP